MYILLCQRRRRSLLDIIEAFDDGDGIIEATGGACSITRILATSCKYHC